jgi:hypothetical protein
MGPPNASFPGTSQWLLNLGPSSSSTSRPTFALSSLQFPLWRHCECSSTPVLHRPQRLATFPGPDHSQNAKFAASCVHGLLCRRFDEAACMRRSRHLLQRNLAPSFAAHKFQNTYLSSELLRYLLRICPHWPMHQLAPSSNSAFCSRLGKTHTLFLRAQAFTYCTNRRSRTEPSSTRSP